MLPPLLQQALQYLQQHSAAAWNIVLGIVATILVIVAYRFIFKTTIYPPTFRDGTMAVKIARRYRLTGDPIHVFDRVVLELTFNGSVRHTFWGVAFDVPVNKRTFELLFTGNFLGKAKRSDFYLKADGVQYQGKNEESE